MTPASTADLRDLFKAVVESRLYFFSIHALMAYLEDPVRSAISATAATIFSEEGERESSNCEHVREEKDLEIHFYIFVIVIVIVCEKQNTS